MRGTAPFRHGEPVEIPPVPIWVDASANPPSNGSAPKGVPLPKPGLRPQVILPCPLPQWIWKSKDELINHFQKAMFGCQRVNGLANKLGARRSSQRGLC